MTDEEAVNEDAQQPRGRAENGPSETALTSGGSGGICCAGCQFDGVEMAKGYNALGTGRGPLIMSNIFLSSALLYLASEEVGCLEEVFYDDTNTTVMEVAENCDEQVYGVFKPAALITNIGVISGLLSAVLMPVIGAIVDYTPHRRTVGIVSSILIILVQGIQIGTGSNTWFAMSILQAVAGFFYQVNVLSTYAYLPDISQMVGEQQMTNYTSIFSVVQYMCQASFLVLVIGLSLTFGWNDVMTARTSQAINTVWIIVSFYLGWKLIPNVGARHPLPEGKSLLLQGFRQNLETAKRIHRDYKKGLRWFLLALIFAEAGANAFTIVAVVYLDEQLGLSGTEIGIFFLVCLVAMIPGSVIASFVTSKTNPNTSWRLSLICLFGLGVFGGLVLNGDNVWPVGYVWGFLVGLNLGWFYPTENLFFSMIIPKGQEAELSGIFVYCSQIIGWLPPLIFSILVENNIDQGIGVIVVTSFALVAVALLSMASSWPEIVEDVRKGDVDTTNEKESNNSTNDDLSIPESGTLPPVSTQTLNISCISVLTGLEGSQEITLISENFPAPSDSA